MSDITDTIRERLSYDAATGRLTWINSNGRRAKAGAEAGGLNHGYRRIVIFDRELWAHRIAWLLHYGEWPPGMIDHVNGDRSDNRIENLRIATPSENARNRGANVISRTGLPKGVTQTDGAKTYQARIRVDGRRVHLGSFPTADEAHAAYAAAAGKYHGEFARSA